MPHTETRAVGAWWRSAWTHERGNILYWLCATLPVALFGLTKVLDRLFIGRRWHSFGRLDIAELVVLALIVGALTHIVRVRTERALAAAECRRREEEARRQRAEALAAENAAVIRVAHAVAREFAQPLSGALAYSEMVLARADELSAPGQQEVEGLREGVLQLTTLLHTLRRAVVETPAQGTGHHVADDVERSVAAPRPYVRVRRAAASISDPREGNGAGDGTAAMGHLDTEDRERQAPFMGRRPDTTGA